MVKLTIPYTEQELQQHIAVHKQMSRMLQGTPNEFIHGARYGKNDTFDRCAVREADSNPRTAAKDTP